MRNNKFSNNFEYANIDDRTPFWDSQVYFVSARGGVAPGRPPTRMFCITKSIWESLEDILLPIFEKTKLLKNCFYMV